MQKLTGKTYYDSIGQDGVAMIVNDMITLGALPSSVAMHLSVGDSKWFEDEKRVSDLVEGWKNACNTAGAIWGCGETPTLKDILLPGVAELSGSATGIITNENHLFKTSKIADGDVIIFIESSGIHSNGLTLARKIASQLSGGYMTTLPGTGHTYGEELLTPTTIYVPYIRDWLKWGSGIHYGVNITGHGWRKLMRAPQSFQYVIEKLPWQNPIFDFIQKQGNVTDEEMYGNYNMGAGFALFVTKETAEKIIDFERQLERNVRRLLNPPGGYITHEKTFIAGRVEKNDSKRVIIEPKDLVFESHTLAVRQ
jgi:phosphoribosylformylglycinamidine cyclo-ligase